MSGGSPLGGSGGSPGNPGTIPGTLEDSLRAAVAAALAIGDYATAEGLVALLKASGRPGAEVVDLATRRTREAG